MTAFRDTWQLDIDNAYVDDLDDGEVAVGNLDKGLRAAEASAKALAEESRALAKEQDKLEKETEALADALEKAKAEGDKLAKAKLSKELRESKKAAKGLNKEARELAKAERDAAREAKGLARGLDQAAKAADRLAKERLENTKKGIEGIAQGMQFGALSGERLANVWLAAGAAAGTLVFAGISLVKDALATYVVENKEAAEAAKRLSQSYKDLQVAAIDAALGQGKITDVIDKSAIRMDIMTEALKDLRGEEEKLTGATLSVWEATKDNAEGMATALFPVANLARGIDDLVGAYDDLFDVQEKVDQQANARSFAKLKGIFGGAEDEVRAFLAKGSKDLEAFEAKEAAKRERGRKEEEARQRRLFAELERQRSKAARAQDAANRASAKSAEQARKEAIAGLSAYEDLLESVEAVNAATAAARGSRGGFAGRAASLTQGGDSLTAMDLSGSLKEANQGKADITSAVGDFGASGIALATDQLGLFIEKMAAGTLGAQEFGAGMLSAIGGWVTQFGEAMILAGTMALFVQSGNLLVAPAAAIGMGVAAVGLGAVMSGLGTRASGSSGGGGSTRAAASARQVSRELSTSRDDRESRNDAPVEIWMDGALLGRLVDARQAQTRRRGGFTPLGAAIGGRR